MQKLLKHLVLLILITTLSSCSTEKAIDDSKYEDAERKTMLLFKPDISLKKKNITIPNAKRNSNWHSSGGIFNKVPENISVSANTNLLKTQTYKLHSSFSRDYHFVGNTPVILKDKLFVLGNKSTVHAYALSNLKKPIWKKSFDNTEEDSFRGGGIFITKGYLAVTYGSDIVKILNPDTGKEKWQYKMSNISKTAPIIYKNKVFVLTVDNKLYCLNLSTGLLIWINEGAAEQLGVIKTSSPIIYKDHIIVPYSVGQVYAVNIADGKQTWNLALDEQFSSIGDLHTPVISNNIAYISSFKGNLYALNLLTGNIEWNNHYAGGNSIWIAGDYIFTVNKNSQLAAVNRFNGKVKWIQNLSNFAIDSRPIIINKKLFVPSLDGILFVISPFTGKILNKVQIPKERYSAPIATQNSLYLLSNKGNLLILN